MKINSTIKIFKSLLSWIFKVLLVSGLVFGVVGTGWGQTTIFTENMGSPSGTTAIGSNAFQNSTGSLTYSGTGDVRSTSASSGYTGASGNGNVFLTNTSGTKFQIANIVTTGYSSLSLSFGAFKSTTASNMSELTLEYSTDGTNYSTLTIPAQPTGSGTAIWRLISGISLPVGAQGAGNLRLRWTNSSSTPQFRIDDVILTGVASSCTAPSTQASGTILGSPTPSGLTASWTAGNGNGTMAVIRPTSSSITSPVSGTSYTANLNYGSAGTIDANNRVVFRAAGTTAAITGLSAETQYTVTTYEYNTTGNCYQLTSPIFATAYTLSTSLAAHAASFTATAASPTSITLSFSAASSITNADGYLILQRAGSSAPTGIPSNATSYSVGNTIGDGTVAAVITSSSAVSQVISSLSVSTQYSFSLIPFNWDGSNSGTCNYYTVAAIPSATATTQSLSAPVITSPTAASISNTTATLGANVTSDGGATISARGVVWAVNTTNSNPTIGGTGCTNVVGTGTTGVFTVAATGLPAGTVISYRGYATNSQGTTYTTATTFTTLENASKLAFGTDPPSTGTISTNLTSFTVLAQRTDNSTDNTYTGNITISKVSGSGTISGTLTVAAVAGVATFSAVQFNVADTYTIKASASGLTDSPNSGNITINTISSSATDQFRSATSGNWNSVATWQSFSSGVWVSATLVPSTSAASVSILSGHTVLGTGSFGACPLTIQSNGGLLVDPTGTFTLCDKSSPDLSISSGGLLSVAGVLINNSTSALSNSGSFMLLSGGNFVQSGAISSGSVSLPSISWDSNSTLSITGWTSLNPNGYFSASTPYGNVVWNCPNHSGTLNAQGSLSNIKGNLEIKNTGASGILRLHAAGNGGNTVTVGGDFIVSGGTLEISNGSGSGTTANLFLLKSLTISGGTLSSNSSNPANIIFAGTSNSNNYSQSGGVITSTYLNFSIPSNSYLKLSSSLSVSSSRSFVVNGTLEMGTSILSGSGGFTLASGGTLITSNLNGVTGANASTGSIQMSGSETYNSNANYIFDGSSNQSTGFLGSSGKQVLSLANISIINNARVITLDGDITLNGTLMIPSNITFSTPSTMNISKGTSGIVSITGVFQTGDNNGFSAATGASLQGFSGSPDIVLGLGSVVDYNGTASQTITNQVPYQNLFLSISGDKTAAGNISILQNLSVSGSASLLGQGVTVTVGGNWTVNSSGTGNGYQPGTNPASLVVFNSSNDQTIFTQGGETFRNLWIDGNGTKSLLSDVNISVNALTISGATFDVNTKSLNGTGDLIMSGGVLRLAKTNTVLPELTGSYLLSGGLIELYGSGNQILNGTNAYNNLLISNLGITTLSSAISTIYGTLSITGTATVDGTNRTFGGATSNLYMSGNSLFRMAGTGTKPNFGGNYTLGSNTKIEFYNSLSSLQQIRSKVYANIDVTGSSVGQTALTGGDITVSGGNFNVFPNAKFSLYGQSVKGSGSFIVHDNATFYFDCYGTDGSGLTSAANSGTIQTSSKSFSSNATYGFVGTSACSSGLSTGDLFPTSVGDLYSEKSAYPVKLTNNLTVNGTFTFATVAGAATAIDISGKNLIVNGSIGGVSTGVTFTSNNSSGFYISNASGPKLILPSFVSTLSGLFQVDRTLGVQLNGPLTLNGTVNITAGGIDLNGNSLALNGATYADQSIINGAGTVSSNAYFRTSNSNGFSGNGATIPIASVTLGSGSIVEFINSSIGTLLGTNISTPNNFQSVILSGSGTTYLPSDFNLGANGYLNIGTLHSLDTKGDSYLVPTGVAVTVGGTLISANTNGVSGFSGSTFSSTNSPIIYPTSGSTINYNGNIQSISPNLIYQNIIFNGTGPKVFPDSPNVLNVQGDITNNLSPSTSTPSFTYGTSTVSLTGSNAQSILGNGRNSFYNLVIDKSSNALALGASNFMNEVAGILTIKSGSSTALYTNDKLTLVSTAAGTVSALYAGSLIDLNSSANSGGSVSGNVVVQRAAVGGPSNRAFYMSMPVSGNLDQMQSVSTNYYFYNETKTSGVVSTGSRSQLWEKVTTPSSVSNSPGRAYSYRFKTRTTAPKGIVYNGTFDVSVSNTGQFTTSTTNNGWNLIGNPYPSPIDLDEVGDDPNTTNIAGSAFYVWDGEKYCIWSSLLNEGTNMSSSIIGSMQGFFIRAISNGNVRFTNNARTSGEADNKQFYRISGNNLPKIGLSISDGSKSDEVKFVVYDQSDASGAFDVKSDALKVVSLPATVPYLYANKSSLPTSIFTIPSLSSIERIPLSVISVSDSNHTFSVTKIQNFDPSVSVYLEDKELGVLQDLNVNPNYTTRIAKGTQSGRFSLVFRSSVVTNTFNKVGSSFKMYANDSKLIIESNLENSVTMDLKVFDVTGKLIVEKSGFELIPKLNEVQLGQLVNGVYSVHLISDSKMETEKILLINY